jgi:transposase
VFCGTEPAGGNHQKVCQQYVKSRKQHKKKWLRFRGKKSLGWVPFRNDQVTFDGKAFTFNGVRYEPMHLREGVFYPAHGMSGSFNQDAQGHWYINVTIEMRVATEAPNTRVGIDLGLESVITLSQPLADGRQKVEPPQFYRKSEEKLATLERAKKTPKRIRKIHRKIANRRKDWQHQTTAQITKEFGFIAFGDVSSSKLAKTNMAKSVLDAGWAGIKNQLSYKALMRAGMGIETNEASTSQVTSRCGIKPDGRPKGIRGLRIREIVCHCGNVLDRDVNASINILRRGLATLAGGTKG